jgi:hypothetical protein
VGVKNVELTTYMSSSLPEQLLASQDRAAQLHDSRITYKLTNGKKLHLQL